MSARDTEETTVSPSGASADPPPVSPARPSWEAASPVRSLDAARRPVPRPAPAEAPRPYYAAPPRPAPSPVPSPTVASYPEEAVQYDLAGNPIAPKPTPAISPAHSSPGGSPYAPPAPFGYSAGAASSWPPPVGGYAPGGGRNNSGEQDHLPPEIARLRWHWGAFFFPILWTKKHGLTTIAAALAGGLFVLRMLRVVFQFVSPAAFLALCGVYAVTYFGVQLYFGLNGHRIGWRNRHFPGGLEEYFKVQNAWMWWGLAINVLLWPALLFMLGMAGLGLSAAHSGSYGSGYGSGYSRPAAPWPGTGNTTPGNTGSAPPAPGGN